MHEEENRQLFSKEWKQQEEQSSWQQEAHSRWSKESGSGSMGHEEAFYAVPGWQVTPPYVRDAAP